MTHWNQKTLVFVHMVLLATQLSKLSMKRMGHAIALLSYTLC